MGTSFFNTAMQSPSRMFDRYDEILAGIRGKGYWIAPGTGALLVGGKSITPSDSNDGLSPYTPLATVNSFFGKVAQGDAGILMEPGTYTLTANISSAVDGFALMGAPGWSPNKFNVIGAAGAHAISLTGEHVRLEGFAISSGDAAKASLEIRARHAVLRRMRFTNEAVTPLAGLLLNPMPADDVASFATIEDCIFDYNDTGLLFGFTTGDFPGSANCLIQNCLFRANVTNHIGQQANSYINGNVFYKNAFQTALATIIDLDNVSNGADDTNAFIGNYFGVADSKDGTTVKITAGGFQMIGNMDKTNGLVTAFGA